MSDRSTPLLDTRAGEEIGRRARLELRFAWRGGRSVLAHAYAEPPFRIGKCFDDRDGLHLIIASSAPGVFGGDRFEQRIAVEAGARVTLTSQSSLQVHPGLDGGTATIDSRFEIGADASLACEWHPVIPFPRAAIDQRFVIDAADGARLWWSDAVMSGREARGERWQFFTLAHELRLLVGGRLRYLERYQVEPSRVPPDTPWLADDSCYLGTVLSVGPDLDRAAADQQHEALQGMDGVRAAADLLEPGIALVRLMAAHGVAFHAARERARESRKA